MQLEEDHMSYLKRYVQNHPKNRMAWYLLGKQYLLEDKEGKANYCFLQSGSIYDAYERKEHPLANQPKALIAKWNRKQKLTMLAARTAAATILLSSLMLIMPIGWAKDEADSPKETALSDTKDEAASQQRGGKSQTGGAQAPQSDPPGLHVAIVKPAGDDTMGKALSALLRGAGRGTQTGIAAMLQQNGKWRSWTGGTRLLAMTKRQGDANPVAVNLLDGAACDCQPSDSTAAYKMYEKWSAQQEQEWTLRSAIVQYRWIYKAWPSRLSDLTRPYPNNVLAGTSGAMQQLFPKLLTELKASSGRADASAMGGKPSASGSGSVQQSNSAASQAGAKSESSSSADDTKLPEDALSIVIDKDKHQLAVVSGDVIVRSYKVGLGGQKTPAGSFYISEKVRHPNGRDDSEFGSRGMILSKTLYAIHGTQDQGSIGMDESHGCVRMLQKDLEELYDLVPLGTKVTIKSGVLPASTPKASERFRLKPVQDETNTAVVYKWLN
ncbi:L,D-transpeptidase-like protein [Paenibacillus taihuensis]|uniref:L,D-transpeptidase-like protein n=1 Tax=Paenibacillus taihuensis TaxID=1156355 RepID=A0A3D9RY67_9BACL|nr:L,D-transpeptidase [Paenibacillus taihuensis]REE84378.1 L,D-transpeptidase-like protein [Paenibacillus taihuensis]